MRRILIASDHAGFHLKEKLKFYLEKKLAFKVKDLGVYSDARCDYPRFAYSLAKEISKARFRRGILVCKSGIGNSIVANRLAGVRAALCYNVKAARLSRQHNDSNVLVLPSGFLKGEYLKKVILTWLKTGFEGGRHLRRLKKVREIEERESI